MKNLLHFFSVVILFVAIVSLSSCSNEKYTVWTQTATYSDFQTYFQTTLSDGYYKRIEIPNDIWKELGGNLTSEGRHRWSEEEIKKWLIGNGFDDNKARKESSWLVMIDHGLLVTRDGNLVYLILK